MTGNTPATRRLEALHARQHEINQEMRGGAEAGPEGFDNEEWLIAESASLDLEVKQVMKISDVEGKIPYDEGFEDPANPDNYDD